MAAPTRHDHHFDRTTVFWHDRTARPGSRHLVSRADFDALVQARGLQDVARWRAVIDDAYANVPAGGNDRGEYAIAVDCVMARVATLQGRRPAPRRASSRYGPGELEPRSAEEDDERDGEAGASADDPRCRMLA